MAADGTCGGKGRGSGEKEGGASRTASRMVDFALGLPRSRSFSSGGGGGSYDSDGGGSGSHPIFYDSVKMHKKRNVSMKCSLSFSFAFKSNCLNPSVE